MNLYSTAAGATVQVSGTWAGTLEFEGSSDNTTYYRLRADPQPDGVYVTNTVNNGLWYVYTAGVSSLRVRASSWTSGTATVNVNPTPVPPYGSTAVTGVTGTVAVAGAVDATLTQETLSALGPQAYTLRPDDWVLVGSTLAIPVPADLPDGGPGALPGRTELRIVNASSTAEVACDPPTADGGLPEWGVRGTPLFPSGGYGAWEARDNVRVYCRARSGSSNPVAPLEKAQ